MSRTLCVLVVMCLSGASTGCDKLQPRDPAADVSLDGIDSSADGYLTPRDIRLDLANDTADVADATTDASDTLDTPDVAPTRTDLLQWVEVGAAAGLTASQWDLPETPNNILCGEAALFTGGAAVHDIDGDGFDDIFLARYLAPHQMMMNQGDGTFVDAAAELGLDEIGSGNGAAFVDADGDGDLDLFVSYLAYEWLHLFVQQDDGTFVNESTQRLPDFSNTTGGCQMYQSISAADFDRDGDLDVHVSQWASVRETDAWRSRLLINDGTGVFSDGTLGSGLDTWDMQDFTGGWADVDADGWLDFLLASDFGDSQLFQSRRNGTFARVTELANVGRDQNGMGSAIGDLDGDGDLDWFVTAIFDPPTPGCGPGWGCSGNRLYLNDGTGVFEDGTWDYAVIRSGWAWGTSMFDADLDGDLDIAATNGHAFWWDVPASVARVAEFVDDPTRLWLNQGVGLPMLERATDTGLTHNASGKALITFDMENDGDLDMLIVNNGHAPSLFRNDSPAGAWLRVRLDGISNRFGVGAEVWVTPSAGDVPLRRDVTLNSGYLGHGPIEAHFGFDQHQGTLHEVRVVWPDSRAEAILLDVAPNQVLFVQQAP